MKPIPQRMSLLLLALITLPVVRAAGADVMTSPGHTAAGAIEGRVYNPTTGEYLENARLTIEGTSLEAFTEAGGYYRLGNVPAGETKVHAFRTGITAQVRSVNVAPGETARLDFELTTAARTDDGTVKLQTFVVGGSKEMDGAAIAINTQRFAPNVMNVVAADEYNAMTEGGVGELLKAVPGMNVQIGGGGEPYLLSMNGVPPNNVPVMINGFNLANATAGTSHQTGIEQISMNNVSRIEVAYTPTPETTGSALAGTVNLVPRSAFERSKPVVTFTGYYALRDSERDFNRTPGPVRNPERKIRPGIDFSAIVPVSHRFGFTVSASVSSVYTGGDMDQMTWRGIAAATNGTTLPDTTPGNPYLTDFTYGDQPKLTKRNSFGVTLDLKPWANDRVSVAFMRGFIDFYSNNRAVSFAANRVAVGNFGATFTHGFAGAGEIQSTNNVGVFGGTVYMPTLTYVHLGPIWKFEAGAGHSHSTRHNHNIEHGHFANVITRRPGVTVSFDDIFYLRPGTISVTDGATGAAVNPQSLASYTLSTATGAELAIADLQRSAYGNVRREFFGRVPLTVKTGFDVRQTQRDQRSPQWSYAFVGADHVGNTADDNALIARDDSFSTRIPPFGFPRTDWISNHTLWDLWKANPSWFTLNEVARHTGSVAQSKFAEETISAAYLRGDLQFLNGRLKLVGGVRAEQTNVKGAGQLIDPTRNFRRDPAGHVILGSDGLPQFITTDPLQSAQLTNIDRGLHAEKEYLRWFPSLNAAFNLRDNFVARFGYYQSVGRPDLVQYAGSLTLPNTEKDAAPDNRITVNNAGIKAWTARTYKATLEYYFENVGLVSVAVFQRDIRNFFGSTVFVPTKEFLTLYGLDPDVYGAYEVNTQYNLPPLVRMTGVDVNYKQALTFLPTWARGVQVYANASALRATGDDAANFNFVPRTLNGGISLTRPKFSVQFKWNYNSRKRQGLVTGRGVEPGTYNWTASRVLMDVIGEYHFHPHWSVFANLNNVTDAPSDLEIFGPNTPERAQFRRRLDFGSLWTIGAKATF